MEKIKPFIKEITELSYIVTLTLLGNFELGKNNFTLPIYQLIAIIYVVSGIFRLKYNQGNIKEFRKEMIKDFIVANIIIICTIKVTNVVDRSLVYSASSIFVHNILLLIMFAIVNSSRKLCGDIAYVTHSLFFIISLILIKLGVPILASALISIFVIEPINYFGYKRKSQTNCKSKDKQHERK